MDIHLYFHDSTGPMDIALNKMSQQMKEIQMNMQDLATELNKMHDENEATKAAIMAELATLNSSIDTLTAEVAAAGNTTPEVDAAVAAVQASADELAALVPAAPTA